MPRLKAKTDSTEQYNICWKGKTDNPILLQKLIANSDCKDKQDFALKDPGTKSRARVQVNNPAKKCVRLHIDSDLLPPELEKCDWCICDYPNAEYLFVELKGSRLQDAVSQLKTTIEWFQQNINDDRSFKIYKEIYVILSGVYPCHNTVISRFKLELKNKYHTELMVRRSQFIIRFS